MGTMSCKGGVISEAGEPGKYPGLPGGVVVLDVVQNLMADNAHQLLEAQRWQPRQQAPHDLLCSHCIDALQWCKILNLLPMQAWAQHQPKKKAVIASASSASTRTIRP